MARRKSRIARGTNIGLRSVLMGESAVGAPETLGKNRWERQFRQVGIPKWVYHMEIVNPYTSGFLGVHPDLTEEQRQVAVKEFLRRYREGMPAFLSSLAMECYNFAKALIVTVPARSPKPSMGLSPEILI